MDQQGDLFIADTDQCRIYWSRPVLRRPLRHTGKGAKGHGTGRQHVQVPSHSSGYPTGIGVDGQGDVYVAEATDQRVL